MENNKLIGFDDLFKNLVNLYRNNKLPNKILLSGKKGIGKFLFLSHYVTIFDKMSNHLQD